MDTLILLGLFFSGLLGACFGSFMGVCIGRIPAGRSIVLPPSHCDHCGNRLTLIDNVPLLAYLYLFGRCRYCQSHIPVSAFFYEALLAVGFATAYLHTPFLLPTGVHYVLLLQFTKLALLIFFLITLAIIDLKTMIIPDELVFSGTLFALILSLGLNPTRAVTGLIVGYAMIAGIIHFYYFVRKVEGMGWGDAKLLALIGAFLGPTSTFITLFYASIVGSLILLPIALWNRGGLKSAYPFGPFIALGALIDVFIDPITFDYHNALIAFSRMIRLVYF